MKPSPGMLILLAFVLAVIVVAVVLLRRHRLPPPPPPDGKTLNLDHGGGWRRPPEDRRVAVCFAGSNGLWPDGTGLRVVVEPR